MKITLLVVSSSLLLGFASCSKDIGKNIDLQPKLTNVCDSVKYSTTIEPIIVANCSTSGCHDAGSGNGDYTTYAGVKQKVDNGTFKMRVVDGTPTFMPATGSLPAEQIAKITCWLNTGAPNN